MRAKPLALAALLLVPFTGQATSGAAGRDLRPVYRSEFAGGYFT